MNDFELKILTEDENIFSLQKCYVSSLLFERLSGGFQPDSYVIIHLSPECKCVCKLIFKTDLHTNFCYFDSSVVTFGIKSVINGLPCTKPLRWHCDTLLYKHIQAVPKAVSIKTITLSIVFESVHSIRKWDKIRSKLLQILRNILRLFVVVESCVVSLKNLKRCQTAGINCLVVHCISWPNSGDIPIVGRITSTSKIVIKNLLSTIKYEQIQNATSISSLGGLQNPYQTLKEIITFENENQIRMGIKPCRQVLLVGPPGCGKTSLVRKLAADTGAVLLPILGPEVCSSQPGDTETTLRNLFKDAADLAKEGTCIILLDEVDSLCPKRSSKGVSSHVTRATTQLLTLLEQASEVPGLVIVATTNRPFALDSALRRPGRLESEIYIGVPSEPDRIEILSILSAPLLDQHSVDKTNLCTQVARLTPGYVGADLALLCQDVAFTRYRRKELNHTSQFEDWLEDFRRAVARIRPSSLRSGLGVITTQPASLSEIGGLDNIKQALQVSIEWPLLYPEAFARLGLPQPRGVLLYGPPGCAKTTIARALACASNTTFLSVSAAELYSPFVGDAERSVAELFHRARLGAPTILFIDEIDALVGSRGEREKGVQEQVLSAFLTEMDGIGIRLEKLCITLNDSTQKDKRELPNNGVIVIAATNRPDMLDDALLRPGRFDKLLYVPPPDAENRLEILKILLSKTPLSPCVDLEKLAQSTEFYSGADLTSLCREATMCVLTEQGMDASHVQHKHFQQALAELRPSLSKQQLDWYNNYNAKPHC